MYTTIGRFTSLINLSERSLLHLVPWYYSRCFLQPNKQLFPCFLFFQGLVFGRPVIIVLVKYVICHFITLVMLSLLQRIPTVDPGFLSNYSLVSTQKWFLASRNVQEFDLLLQQIVTSATQFLGEGASNWCVLINNCKIRTRSIQNHCFTEHFS